MDELGGSDTVFAGSSDHAAAEEIDGDKEGLKVSSKEGKT